MCNSTIKDKIGICVDCPPGSEPQPIIAGRCKKLHYKRHRAMVSAAKKAAKEQSEGKKHVPKKIPRRSKKRLIQELQYNADVKVFLGKPENKTCPVTRQKTTEVHHKKGRIGDLLLDQRFWLAVSSEGHRRIEENPQWAKEMGYSLNRLSNEEI